MKFYQTLVSKREISLLFANYLPFLQLLQLKLEPIEDILISDRARMLSDRTRILFAHSRILFARARILFARSRILFARTRLLFARYLYIGGIVNCEL